jgi:hypothetical protein
MINQVDHREGAGPQTAERESFVALRRLSKGFRAQPATGTNQAFLHQKTSSSMKTGPNGTKTRLQAALWQKC